MTRITIPAPQWIDRNADVSAPSVVAPLDAEDMARVLATYRGQPNRRTAAMRYVRSSDDGGESVYVFDAQSGMVYLLD